MQGWRAKKGLLEAGRGLCSGRLLISMSEKTSRKSFLFAAGAAVAGWLAFRGAKPEPRAAEASNLPVQAKPEPRAVPLRRA